MRMYKEAARKTYERSQEVTELVGSIIENVKLRGDQELLELTKKFDGIDMDTVRVGREEIEKAYSLVSGETIEAIKNAAAQIRFFAGKQLECMTPLTTASPVAGVTLGHRLIPVETVGAYVPAGRYPLPSTALMLAIPAKVAGVKRVVACSPASKGYGTIHPAVLVAMDIAGIDEIYCTGGAQAIAAMAYGTETVKKVDLIAGPANPQYTAIDLLAQSEHDPNARATLVTTSEEFAGKVMECLYQFAGELSTGETARKSWEDNGTVIIAGSLDEAIAISDDVAPEHLEVHTHNSDAVAARLRNFGSLFIGEYTPVAFGDYCSGTNHTLPTMATAKYSNGVWVGTFLKTSFTQHISREGCLNLSRTCVQLAGEEGLFAHQKSVLVRVE